MARPECMFDPAHQDVIYTEIVGFDTPRSGGGTNHVVLRMPTGRFACRTCIAERMSKKTEGVMPGQEVLL